MDVTVQCGPGKKTNVNGILGKAEGQTWTDTLSFSAGPGKMGVKKGKLIENLQFSIKVFPCLEYLWKQKDINMANN